jgi:hypothetical protein
VHSEEQHNGNDDPMKTPGLIIEIVIPLTYISKVCYIKSRCCSCDNNP